MPGLTNINLITILGPTASGKTTFAAKLAHRIGGEVISADSRQVYRGMNIGTGKDYQEYLIDDTAVPYHLIDILDAGEEYNVFEFQKDFARVFQEIHERNSFPVLCGGTGLYLQSILRSYTLLPVPLDKKLRESLSGKSMKELTAIFCRFRSPHNTTDTLDRKRLIRAIEIETYYSTDKSHSNTFPEINSLIFGIQIERHERRRRISERLKERLDQGLIEEVQLLMQAGLSEEKLVYYGLEYKYISWYLSGEITKEEMFERLNTAIHQFAKRQMTWFRKMEREGMKIFWMDAELPDAKKIELALQYTADHTDFL